jgi:plastocyanin
MAIAVFVLIGTGTASAAATSRAGSKHEVKVLLSEWILKPKPKTVAAGKVKFAARDAGGETHEVVIVRGADPKALPTKSDGSVDESQIPAADKIGEIEGVKAKKTKTKTFRLTPGSYVLFCNIVDDMGDVHFAKGMYGTLRVK